MPPLTKAEIQAPEVIQPAEDRIDYWCCYATVAPQLLDHGFEPLPVEGKAVMIRAWTTVLITPQQVTRTAAWCGGASVGLRTGWLVAIDIDITDPDVAERVSRSARERFGAGLVRIGLAPKLLLLYATDTPMPKHESALWVEPDAPADSKGHRVEILGAGQQFVAYGLHAKTNQPYRWPNGGPLDIEAWELLTVDPLEVHRWVDDVVPTLIPETWEERKKGTRGRIGTFDWDDPVTNFKPPHDDVTLEDARWMLDKLNELQPERCDDRGDWLRVGMALHHQFDASPEAFELWFDWSSASEKFNSEVCEACWDQSFEANTRSDQTTIGTVKRWLDPLWKERRAAQRPARALAAPTPGDATDELDEFGDLGRNQHTVDYGDEMVARLRAMSSDEVRAGWIGVALLATTPVAEAKIITEVARQTAEGVTPLKAELKRARDHLQQEARRARLTRRVGAREMIRDVPDKQVLQARRVEQLILDRHTREGTRERFFEFSGMVSAVRTERMPGTHGVAEDADSAPEVPLISALKPNHVLEEVETVALFVRRNEAGEDKTIEVPQRIVSILMDLTERAAPLVTGLVTHPIVLQNGSILSTDGIHTGGLVLSGAEVTDCKPYSQHEASAALKRIQHLFSEFEFRSELDQSSAVAMLLTGVQRKLLDMAPGFAVLASEPGTGKTTLARLVHLILTRCDLPVMAFSERDPDEVKKAVFAALLRSPTMVCFDNITEGTTFRSSALAMAFTGAQMTDRVLGFSRDATVSTATLFVLTGNNLSLGTDEVSRWVPVRLKSSAVHVHRRQFKNADVVAYAHRVRADVLRDCVGIVAGYIKSGVRNAKSSRFPEWERMVCEPLAWAGGARVSDVFEQNERTSEAFLSRRVVLEMLRDQFGDRSFTARDVVGLMDRFESPLDEVMRATLQDALGVLRVKAPTEARSVGRGLSGLKDMKTQIGDSVFSLAGATGRLGEEYTVVCSS